MLNTFHEADGSATDYLSSHRKHSPKGSRTGAVPLHPHTSDDSGNESSLHPPSHTKNNAHFVVVAIDFGTTYSGYAFAFTRDIDSILMMRKVDGNDPGSCAFIFLPTAGSVRSRCDQSKDAHHYSLHSESGISLVRILCTRLLSRSRSRRSEALALLREVQNASASHPSKLRSLCKARVTFLPSISSYIIHRQREKVIDDCLIELK